MVTDPESGAILLRPEEQIGYARAGEAAGAYLLLAPLHTPRGRPPLWEVVVTRLDSDGDDQVFTASQTAIEINDFLNSLDLDLAPPTLVPRLMPVLFPGLGHQYHLSSGPASRSGPPPEVWWTRVLDRTTEWQTAPLVVVRPERDSDLEARPARRRKRRIWTPLLGVLAAGFAGLVVIADVAGILYATNDRFLEGTAMGYSAIASSVVAVLLGIVAVIWRRGRNWGIAAIVIGILANPFLLLHLLLFFGGSLG